MIEWRTVKPLLRVVLSVLDPWLTGVASPRSGEPYLTELMAWRVRRPVCRFKASLRAAIDIVGDVMVGVGGEVR